MITINGENHLTAGDLRNLGDEFTPDQILFCSFIDSSGKLQKRPIYKIAEDADETEVLFYLGGNQNEDTEE